MSQGELPNFVNGITKMDKERFVGRVFHRLGMPVLAVPACGV